MVILGGVLVSAGVLEGPQTIVVAVLGAIIGDNIGFALGRHLGRPWLERHGHLVGMHGGVLMRVDLLFARHGGKAVLVGRFIGFLRAMAPFVAGASRMPYAVFVAYNSPGAAAWGIGFVLLGYFLGESWTIAERWIGRVGVVLGVLVIVGVVVWFWRARRRGPTTPPISPARDRP